jgi:hypothetical protein
MYKPFEVDVPESIYRVVRTARTLEEINQGAKDGYIPLVKKVEPSNKIKSKYCIYQNILSDEIVEVNDFRSVHEFESNREWRMVIDWTFYYPYKYERPYSAYLVPSDIQVGEKVILQDIIEDLVEMSSNQGNVYRLESCIATWNGTDFVFDYDPVKDISFVIG